MLKQPDKQKLAYPLRSSVKTCLATAFQVSKDDHEQKPTDHADVDALSFAFVRKGGEFFFANQLSHASRRGDVTGRE